MLGYALLLAGLVCMWVLFSGRSLPVLAAMLGIGPEALQYKPPVPTTG